MAITQYKGAPVFLYTLAPGGASHSFGVAVAELAGVPDAVVTRAQALLQKLEQNQESNVKKDLGENTEMREPDPISTKLKRKLETISIEETSPLEALNLLADLKNLVD